MSNHKRLTPLLQVESAIAWAAQQGYCFARDTAEEYGQLFGRRMHDDENTVQYGTQSWSDR